MSMIIVSMVGRSVAACKSHDTAIKQIGEMVMGEANWIVRSALENGEKTHNIKVRTVYIELNDK